MNKIYFFINPEFYNIGSYTVHLSKLLIIIRYIYSKYKIEINIVTNLDTIDKNAIIIPNNLEEQKQLYFRDFKNNFSVHPSLYDSLDDKEKCYDLIRFIDPSIPIINKFKNDEYSKEAFSNFLKNNNNFEFFIFKDKNTSGSNNIFIFKKENALNEYKTQKYKNYVIQPYMENYNLNSINLLAENGHIHDFIITNQPNNYDKDNLFGKNFFKTKRNILKKKDPYFKEILNISDKIIRKTKYSGFIEIEFLCEKEVLLLEINPRLSGHTLDINDDYNLIYVDVLIIKFLNIFNISIKNSSKNLNIKKKSNDKIYNHSQLIVFSMIFVGVILTLLLVILAIFKIYSKFNK